MQVDNEDRRKGSEYLRDAREKFVKDSMFMQNRDQFEDYMRVMENQFYETVKSAQSPYVDRRKQEGQVFTHQSGGNPFANTTDEGAQRGKYALTVQFNDFSV